MREPKLYLLDINEAIEKIQRYTAKIDYKTFLKSDEKVDAVVRNLEIIGEAAKFVPRELKQKYRKIHWKPE